MSADDPTTRNDLTGQVNQDLLVIDISEVMSYDNSDAYTYACPLTP